ncbi:membrane protein [Pyrococcus abyssi virus 1]|uniref:membrane protein n=1 Tax=Pyrococcus abyssi virus 1 TaxID=425386 RepID=UPI00015529C8|nr:membrane protein [Pyrococcus abyssi virus 1]ABN58507.1 membrane protein [Pyrococcus abyssi virus 1]
MSRFSGYKALKAFHYFLIAVFVILAIHYYQELEALQAVKPEWVQDPFNPLMQVPGPGYYEINLLRLRALQVLSPLLVAILATSKLVHQALSWARRPSFKSEFETARTLIGTAMAIFLIVLIVLLVKFQIQAWEVLS